MSDWRLTPQNTALVVVDPQEKLMASMPHRAETLAGIEKLVRAARLLHFPALVTLQYPKGLGPICAELAEATAGLPTFEKLSFSCCGNDQFRHTIKDLRRPRIILCGVETHVCVQQTAIDLMDGTHSVSVCADAVCSRRDRDRDVALDRLRDCGAIITTVEAAVFEMLKAAGTDQFKACMPLWKSAPG
jgi:nicotinamidase-related amidase